MRTMWNILSILSLALTLGATAIADELVTNGGFETGDFTGWTVSGDSNGAAVSANNPHTGTYAALFHTSESVRISQMLPTGGSGPAQELNDVVFWLNWIDIPPDYFAVFWNNNPVYFLGDLQSFPYTRFEIDGLPSSGPSLLSFEFSSNPSSTWWIDDISVTGQGVPEPGTLMLLGSGVVGLAGVARRHLFGRVTN